MHIRTSSSPPWDLLHDPALHHNCQLCTETRVYGFDLNEHWQADKEHYDNQKINGLTFPCTIRSSAFTQKLDIEGCDPLALPLAALLCQQVKNHWLRKLAHGREMYLIPTGDIAAEVFTTELLTQLRNRGVDINRVAMVRSRQDGKVREKTSNSKYIAQVIAQQMQGWALIRPTDPDSQHGSCPTCPTCSTFLRPS